MLKFDRWFLLVLALAVVSRIILYSDIPFGWDDSVYIMNAKFYLGDRIYFEEIRPPLLQTLLGVFLTFFGVNEIVIRLLPISISIYSIILTYVFCKRFFGRYIAILASLLLVAIPLHIEWSSVVHTEILSSVFILLSIYFYTLWIRNRKNLVDGTGKFLYIAIYFAAIAGLTRFTSNILFIVYVTFALITEKGRIFNSKYILALFVFILVNGIWVSWNYVNTGDWFYAYKWNFEWASGEVTDNLYFLVMAFPMFSLEVLLIAGGILSLLKKWKNEVYLLLLILSLMFIGFHQIFVHKEARFILPIVPVLVTIGAIFVKDIRKIFRYFDFIVCLLIIISFIQGLSLHNLLCGRQALVDSSIFIGQQEYGKTMSMFWPITAYYSNYPVKAFSENPEELELFIDMYNISYIQVSDRYGWPDYAKNFIFFDRDFLELLGTFNDECEVIAVYKVI